MGISRSWIIRVPNILGSIIICYHQPTVVWNTAQLVMNHGVHESFDPLDDTRTAKSLGKNMQRLEEDRSYIEQKLLPGTRSYMMRTDIHKMLEVWILYIYIHIYILIDWTYISFMEFIWLYEPPKYLRNKPSQSDFPWSSREQRLRTSWAARRHLPGAESCRLPAGKPIDPIGKP